MDARPARLSQHMSETLEDWYPSPIVHDCSAIAAQMEWNELLAAREAGDQIEPERLHTALKGGIPSELRSRAWLSFSGAAERMRRHPQLYEGTISHTVSPICHTSILPIFTGCVFYAELSSAVVSHAERETADTSEGSGARGVHGVGCTTDAESVARSVREQASLTQVSHKSHTSNFAPFGTPYFAH